MYSSAISKNLRADRAESVGAAAREPRRKIAINSGKETVSGLKVGRWMMG